MAIWRVDKEWTIDTPRGEPRVGGTDTSGGRGYRFVHRETGEERTFQILVADGPSEVTPAHFRAVLKKYLDNPDPPERVKLDRRGNEIGGS